MRKNYSSSKPASSKGFNIFAVLFLLTVNVYATVYNGSWNSAPTQTNNCANALSNYTISLTNATSAGGSNANSFIPSGKQCVITFPAGFNCTTVTGVTVSAIGNTAANGCSNGPLAGTGLATTATTVSFNMPTCINKSISFSIVVTGVTNPATGGTYQIASLDISNANCGATPVASCATNKNQFFNSANFTVAPLPAAAGTITGTATVCQGAAGIAYSIPAIANATSYAWSYSGTGFSITSATNIANIITSFSGTATSGNLTVRGINACGNGTWSATFAITVQTASVGGTATASPTSVCMNGTSTITVSGYNGGTIQWESSPDLFTWTPVGTNSPTYVTAPITTTMYYRAIVTNGVCAPAYSNEPSVTITPVPNTPSLPSGTNAVCQGTTGTNYTSNSINATSYTWSITGAGNNITGTGTTGTASFSASFTGTAQIRVQGNNACGSSALSPIRNVTVYAVYNPVSLIQPDLSIRQGLNAGLYWDTICHRTNVTFSNYVGSPSAIQPYPYGAATYEWYWNNNLVQSSTSNQYLNNNLLDNDTVRLRVVPSWTTTTTLYSDGNRCPSNAPFWGNTYHMDVYPSDPPSITSVSASPNPGCQGQPITLTATVGSVGLGNSPQYQWFDVATGAIPGATSLSYLGVFTPGTHDLFFMVTSSDTCASPNQVIAPSPIFYSLVVNLCYDTMNQAGNLTINRCGGTLYDSGGPSGNYSNNENGILTICPALPSQYVSLTFTSFATEAGQDILTIYNGNSVALPVLAPSPLSGTLSCSSPFTSSHSSGCLTLRFQSNGVNTQSGWAANMSCVSTPASSTPGNGCSSPVMITSLPYSITGQTNTCFGNNQGSGCATSNYTGTDKFYRYDASGPECITVNINGATNNAISLSVWKDCPGNVGSICIASWSGAVGGNLGGQTTLPSVGTYYIVADANVGVNFNYNLVINSFGAAPLNDLPCNAEPLIQTIPHYDDNACAGTESGGGINNTNCVSGNINSLWFTFNTNVGQTSARIRYITGVGTLAALGIPTQVYSGTCSALTYINCATVFAQPGAACVSPGGFTFTVSPSTTYYIRIDGSNNNTGSFQIVVDDPNNVAPAYGYDCGNPIAVSAQTCTYGSPAFIGVGNICDFPASNSAGFFGERDGVYFLFQTIAGQNGANTLTFDIYSDNSVTTDWDFIIWNVTSHYPSNICTFLNYGYGPWPTGSGQISSSWVDTWQAPANGHTGCRTGYGSHINGFPFNAPIPLAGTQWWMLYVSNFRFSQYPYGFTLDFGWPITTNLGGGPGAVVYNTTAPPQLIWWTGQGGSSNWNTQANWGGCATPSCVNNTSATVASFYSPSNPYWPVVNASGSVTKDLTIRPGANVTINSGFNLDVCGRWLNMGSFNAQSNSSVTCIGNTTQYFDGIMAGSNSFHNLNMSKSPGIHMYLYNKAQVTGTLGLTNGRIITQAKELFVSNLSPTSVPIGSLSSFVQGNLRRNLDPTGGVYYWPVGLSSSYQLAKFTFGAGLTIPNILGYFSSWTPPGAIGLADGLCGATYNTAPGFLDNGYWTMTASANPTGAQYDAVLYNTAVTNGGGSTAWTVAKAPTIAGPWVLDGNCDMTSTQAATRRNGMTGFSVFATAQQNNPLPITLLNFDAVAKGTGVQTTWVTATEINNDYFVVERSTDGIIFEQVGTKKGAGNSSNTLYYSMLDLDPFKGVSYYRLRQFDFDGQESKSQLVAVSFLETNVLNVFPNPAQTSVQYRFNAAADGAVNFELVDALGKVIISDMVNVTKGLNTSEGFDISFLPNGVYFIQLKPTGSEIIEPMQKRFVKQTREE